MEEKIIIKSGKTAVKKPIVFIMILTFLIVIGAYLYPSFAPGGYENFVDHTVYEEHSYVCYPAEDTYSIDPSDPEWSILVEDRGGQPSNCGWAENDLFSFIYFLDRYYPLFFFVGAIIIFICILFAFLTKSKFYITKTNIYGKSCFKKFNIAFDDIIETTKKGNSIIILTENRRLKLAPLKNCDKIYYYIKSDLSETPVMPEKQVEEQVKNAIDDITNILD